MLEPMQHRATKINERWLINRDSKEECLKRLREENLERTTVSFYRYVLLGSEEEVYDLRDKLYLDWEDLGCLGRVYIAQEGINAQMSVPSKNWDAFVSHVHSISFFKGIPFKIGVEEGESFWKLNIKVKKQIVADGLTLGDYNIENVGTHLNAESFNKAMQEKDTLVVDMRNAYESDIGHFKGAITPQATTFKEELPKVAQTLSGKEDKKILLYCTGGIRCEKASAYLKSRGFNNVNQLHGGIISYKHQVEQQGLSNEFTGANFVFDGRTREQISGDIISSCDDCGDPCDLHINCAHSACNKLFLQCKSCNEKTSMTCSSECKILIEK